MLVSNPTNITSLPTCFRNMRPGCLSSSVEEHLGVSEVSSANVPYIQTTGNPVEPSDEVDPGDSGSLSTTEPPRHCPPTDSAQREGP